MLRRLNDERGLAMVTALMISVVVLIFSVAVVSLSLHNSGASARDRKRVDAISTAEAGLDATMATIQSAVIDTSQGQYTLPCTVTDTLPETPTAQYAVTVNYYATYPPSGNPMACPPTTVPAAATLTSKGTSVTGAQSASRTMEAEARLTPVYGAFGQAIFSNTGINLSNHLGVNGHQGNDADLYTNGNLSCSNNSNIAGSAFVQGTISLSSSCTFAQDGYSKGSVTMSNSALIGHDVISATAGVVMLNSSHINHNVTVKTTCTGCTTGSGGTVGGTVTTGHQSPAPPVRTMPLIDFTPQDAQTWKDAGFTNQPIYTNCVLAHTAILAGYTTKTVARISPACTLTFSGDSVSLKEDLVIMADGPITFANNNTVKSSSSTPHTIYLIEPTNGITNPNCAATNRNISVSNQTNFVGVYTFAYTQCTLTWQNNNDGLGGQMIGGTVNITNLYDMSFVPIVIPTGVVTGFKEDLAFKREIVNP